MVGLVGDVAFFVRFKIFEKPLINARVLVHHVYTFFKASLFLVDFPPELAFCLGGYVVPSALEREGLTVITVGILFHC